MNIGLCIGTSPGNVKTRFMLELAEQCLMQDDTVDVFLFDNGIYNALENRSIKCITNKLKNISGKNSNVNVCINMAKHRGVNASNIAEYIEISSLISFSGLVNNADLVITSR